MKWTVPNILTVVRLVAAPGVAIMFLYFSRPLADWFALILFIGAAVTDWFDGYLARSWHQESKFGAMLDPIADKAMVVIALLVITGYTGRSPATGEAGINPLILLPATAIIFREVFVSGLREFLGDNAKILKVTKLAKWKTTAQMVAIGVLFGMGIFEHMLAQKAIGLDVDTVARIIIDGDGPTELRLLGSAYWACWGGGVFLLWVAAGLTIVTGWDYLRKAMPYLKDAPR